MELLDTHHTIFCLQSFAPTPKIYTANNKHNAKQNILHKSSQRRFEIKLLRIQ